MVILRWHSKNEIPGAALELEQLKINHFKPGILESRIKHVVNPLNLKCAGFLLCLYLYLMQTCVDWVLKILGIQVIKKN